MTAPIPCHDRISRSLAALLLTLCTLGGSALAQQRYPAGYITAIEGLTEAAEPDAVVLREGQALDAQVGAALFAGDRIVTRGAAAVTIETVADKRARIDAARSPHDIRGELPAGGRMAEIAGLIGDLFKSKPSTRTTNLVGRSDDKPVIRIGQGQRQEIAAGEPVWLRWQAGVAPFTVDLRPEGRARLAGLPLTTTANEAVIPVAREAKGRMAIIVRDAAGQTARLPLSIVRPRPVPDWIAAASPTAEYAVVAGALHQLKQNGAKAAVQAASRLHTVPGYAPARQLRDRLAKGGTIR